MTITFRWSREITKTSSALRRQDCVASESDCGVILARQLQRSWLKCAFTAVPTHWDGQEMPRRCFSAADVLLACCWRGAVIHLDRCLLLWNADHSACVTRVLLLRCCLVLRCVAVLSCDGRLAIQTDHWWGLTEHRLFQGKRNIKVSLELNWLTQWLPLPSHNKCSTSSSATIYLLLSIHFFPYSLSLI